MAHPQVSIVIPYFNQEPFVLACLESVLSQSFTDWEAIVVDDASTVGNIRALVEKLCDGRLEVVRHATNRGQGAARNTGFCKARASLVLPLDADDRLHPDFLSAVCKLFSASADIDCAFTDLQLFGSSDDVWHNRVDFTLRDMLLRQWIPGAGTLMRRSVWERTGGYWEEPAIKGNEDWDFWITALSNGLRPAHVALPLYFYRRHDQATSSHSLPYRDYAQRELLYLRHKALYDRYAVGGQFRARGYLNSASFSWIMGERCRAMRLAGKALLKRSVAGPFLRMAVGAVMDLALARRRPWTGGVATP